MTNIDRDEDGVIRVRNWQIAVRDIRRRLEARMRELEAEGASINEELAQLAVEERSVEQSIRYIDARLSTADGRPNLPGTSIKEVLVINFADDEGRIVGVDAASRLTEIGFFGSRRTADGSIYTTLAKPPFEKVVKGEYRIPLDSADWIRLRGPNGRQSGLAAASEPSDKRSKTHRRGRKGKSKHVKSGLRDKVMAIRTGHPDWTRRQVADHLISEGWDFAGKKPYFAVNGGFMVPIEEMPPGNRSQLVFAQPRPRRR